VDIYMGGKVGKEAHLGECVMKGIACEDLKPVLADLLVKHFDAQPRTVPLETTSTVPQQFQVTEDLASPVPPPVTPIAPVPTPVIEAAPAQVQFAIAGKTIDCTEATSILDVAEQAGVTIDSSCRSGTCGTCKHKLLTGQVRYEGEPDALDADEQAAGYVLTCIAHPVGHIVIEA
jgi:ferredoxin-nitrite reductase